MNLAAENDWAKDKFPASDKDAWAVGVNVSWNFWDYGVTAAKVAEAKANVLNAQETYRQTSDSIRLSVRNSYLSLREAEKRIGTSSVSVAEAEEAYRIAVIRYQAGVGTNTDVIDASVYLTTAKNNYITALYDYNTSLAALKQGMGVPVITD
ncbi:MAG: TolC family protein [Acidaminococcaceae bacterium]|nr:TolC family protein [Acidaminococcaceae bacterium]